MFTFSLPTLVLVAVFGMAVGAMGFRGWASHAAKKKRRIPDTWELQARPLLTDVEHAVWHWLKTVFFDHHVLVKIPVIRFMAPRTVAVRKQAHDLLSGVYCTFTVCVADGTAIGCIDLPGPLGLKASNRDLKQKLFAECGMAYAVVQAGNLPTPEAVCAEFLGEIELPEEEPAEMAPLSEPWQDVDGLATEPAPMQTSSEEAPQEVRGLDMQGIDMSAIAEARSSLRAKLERNRKIRGAGFDPLSTSSGIVHDNADRNFAQAWDDSFRPPDDPGKPPPSS